MPEVTVSVVIPVRDGETHLRECIESVLGQTLPPAEILVVDDGSVDGTAELASSFGPPVRLLRQERGGPARARNTGVQAATCRCLAFIDADDVWEPGKLALQAPRLGEAFGLRAVFGHIQHFHSPETDAAFRAAYACPPDPIPGLHAGTMLIGREDFLRVGLFDESIHYGEFLDWHARAAEAGLNSVMLPEVVMRRRIHPSNYGITRKDLRSDYLRVVRGIMQRRKA